MKQFKYSLGAVENDHFISCMTFNIEDNTMYIQNYCRDREFSIKDDILKMIQVVTNKFEIKTINFEVDLSKFTGETFIENGFKIVNITKPILTKVLIKQNYFNIWDCGSLKLEMKLS